MRRRGVGVLGVVVGVGLLSGCSPADLPLAAVWLSEDGKPVATIRPCGGDRVTDVDLQSWETHESDGASDAAHSPGSSSDGPASDGPAGGVADSGWVTWSTPVRAAATTFPLFSPPPSWRAEAQGTQALLPGRTYALTFSGPRGRRDPYNAHVYFTADDLASLEPGQVWADGRAMSRDDFGRLVADRC
jgi:hypothetical protein